MIRRTSLKVVIILLCALVLAYLDVPYTTQKNLLAWTPTSLENQKINLGLDLQGGTQLDYFIDLSNVPEGDQTAIVEGVKTVIEKRVNKLGVAEPNIYISKIGDEQHIVVELAGIKDIDEAKKTVGQVIQLQFKTPREPNDAYTQEVTNNATAILASVQSGTDFTIAGEKAKNDYAGLVRTDTKSDFLSGFQTELQEIIKNLEVGATADQIVEVNDGFIVTGQNSTLNNINEYIVKLTAKADETHDIDHEKEVKASHILISYKDASGASGDVTRSKEEAKTLAETVLAQALTEGADFAALAQQYSEDPGSKDNGGDLDFFTRDKMVTEFSDAAFGLQPGQTGSAIVESDYGFHIIKVTDIKEAYTETVTEPKYTVEEIIFSTIPDPWQDTELNGEHFKHADVKYDQFSNPYIEISFDDEGAALFEKLTEENVDKQIAIFVGGELLSAPRVNEKISGGTAVIEGSFTAKEAADYAQGLNTGAIPAPIYLTSQYTIGASLGADALTKSLQAGVYGVIILMVFMLLYYRLPGLLANIALSIYAVIMLFLIKIALPIWLASLLALFIFAVIVGKIIQSNEPGWEKFLSFLLSLVILFFLASVLSNPITLTLAGIAGVVLSIGMAVDANVLIFERIKEELKAGNPLLIAIETGFDRAWNSIRDSNFSSLITCAILFYFGSSIIQGFALNLAIGILVSMFTAITITKTFLMAAARTSFGDKLWLFNKPKEKTDRHWDIIGRTKYWFAFSILLFVVAAGALGIYGIKFGMDFTGGTLIDIALPTDKTATTDDIKTAVTEALGTETDYGTPTIVPEGENGFMIRMMHIENEQHDAIIAKLKEKFGEITENRFTTIGPTIGASLKKKAAWALILTSLMIVAYIAFAFRKVPKVVSPWKFGVCAIIALLHDVFITIGVFAILGKVLGVEVDALFITALLTVMGFSVHDTIVVFDRIRENLRYQRKGETFTEVVNNAMNQTMARSINTSLCTLLTIIALAIWGAESIRLFVLVLIAGITVGTYSSIFVASPLLAAWKKWEEKEEEQK